MLLLWIFVYRIDVKRRAKVMIFGSVWCVRVCSHEVPSTEMLVCRRVEWNLASVLVVFFCWSDPEVLL
jgi:isopentenyldiphosphate isomerase